MGGTDGTLQLMEILERQSAEGAARGAAGSRAVPAQRRPLDPSDPLDLTGRHHVGRHVQLPRTGPAPVAGPPRSAALPAPAPVEPAEQLEPSAGSRARVLLAVAGLGLVAACWSGASALLADRVPEGTTVAGTAIGGLDRDDAVRVLADALAPRVAQPLRVTLAGAPPTSAQTSGPGASQSGSVVVDPADAHLELDAAATVSRAIGTVGTPASLWYQLVGRGPVSPVVDVDEAALAGAVDRAAVALDVPAVEGSISFTTGQPVATAPVAGLAVDRPAAAALLQRTWRSLAPVDTAEGAAVALPSRVVVPAVTEAAVTDALEHQARPAVSAPLTAVAGERRVVLQPAQVAPALSLVPSGGSLLLQVDGEALAQAVVAADPATAVAAQDARVETGGGAPVVVPAVAGTEPDPTALSSAAARALVGSGDARTVEVVTRAVAPARSTEAVAALGITTLLGQVVSPLTPDPARSTDVALAAAALDGALLLPGEPLDVGALLGTPTAEAGYVPAAVVVDGRATTSLSAGSTQVASAVLAAGWAAGLGVAERTAPESWNPRDPVGLDAVVGADAPLVLTEEAAPGALVRAAVEAGVLRVQVWGTSGRTVALQTAPSSDPRPALSVVDASPQCVAQPGQDGFTTTVARTTTPQGAAAVRDELTTTYAPRTAVTCSAAPAPAVAPALD